MKLSFYQKMSAIGRVFKTIYRDAYHLKLEAEADELHKFISSDSVCFDIGGSYGTYTLVMSRLAKDGCVYSFEPGSYSHWVLKRVIKYCRLKNVSLVNQALGGYEGKEQLVIPQKKSKKFGYSLAHIKSSADISVSDIKEEVVLTTIDKFCVQRNIKRVDFIKCDAEGAEYSIFKGAERTIEKHFPTVLCEVDGGHLNKFGFSPQHIFDFFNQKGYSMYILDKGNLLNAKDISKNSNYFFIHSSKKF
ncbi:MAG: FkbM family methyltransferase [Omnitrophica bacterium]|nr:FkbM family methyltransferase [Candidatus Omnitrophota bacterium]